MTITGTPVWHSHAHRKVEIWRSSVPRSLHGMSVDVVIPCFQRDRSIQVVLPSLEVSVAKAASLGARVDVWYSSQRTSRWLRAQVERLGAQYHLVELPGNGWSVSRARNHGIEAGSSNVVVLIDADVAPCWSAIVDHLAMHRARTSLVVGPVNNYQLGVDHDTMVLPGGGTPLPAKIPCRPVNDPRWKLPQGALLIPWALGWGFNLSFPRGSVPVRFDERMSGWGVEDLDFSREVLSRLGSFTFAPGPAGWHVPHSRNLDEAHEMERANFRIMMTKGMFDHLDLVMKHGDLRANLELYVRAKRRPVPRNRR